MKTMILPLLLVVIAAPGAALNLVQIDPAARDINATAYDSSLAIDGSHAWVCYVDSQLDVILADRELSAPTWRYTVVDTNNLDDAHNLCGVGVDPQGHVHVAYDMHNEPLRYMRTSTAGNPGTLAPATMGGALADEVSYPRFHRAGSAFYFLAREGSSANGDVYMKRLNSSGAWVDVAFPLISGASLSPTDNPYLGSMWPEADGDLHLVWTARIGWYNSGLCARYDAATNRWLGSNGTEYTLPLSRNNAEVIVPATDTTVSNSGHAVAVAPDGTVHVVYHRYPAGFKEVFHARKTAAGWIETQISDLRAPRLRGCPAGPMDGPPRPCDMEVQGAVLVAHPSGALTLLYTRANGPSRGIWARPGGVAYEARSLDGGTTWTVRELHWPVTDLGSEFQRETGGKPYILLQVARTSGDGPLSLAQVTEPLPRPALRVSASGGPLIVPDGLNVLPAFSIVARVLPRPTGQRMGVVDKGGANGQRSYRLLLWGANLGDGLGFRYLPDRVQVLVGNDVGSWGLLWYPQITVPPGVVSHLVVTSNGTTVSLYLNGALAAQTAYAGAPLATAGPTLIGGNYSAANQAENLFQGELDVEIIQSELSAAQVAALFAGN